MSSSELAASMRERLPDTVVARDEVTSVVAREDLIGTLAGLRDDPALAFDLLASITATDWPERSPRFWVSYELYSTAHRHRVRLKVGLSEDDARVPSLTSLYPTADWHERETYDFFGITFEGHPDLSRILLPDDWDGHPLRKTEELGGVNTRFKGAFVPPVDRRTT